MSYPFRCRLLLLTKRYSSSNTKSVSEQIGDFFRESPVPKSQSERLLRFGGLAASIGIGAAGQFIKRISGSNSSVSTTPNSIWFSKENVERIVSTLTRMRGAALKLGQMVSMQDNNLFPPEIEEIFSRVRDGANYMPIWQMKNVLCDELGPEWANKFKEFEEKPFAAASIGQVHRATLLDDTRVAVKIQYPGIAQSIVSDLENLKGILLFSQLLPKGLFLENSIKVAQRELAWECDYKREAHYMEKFRSNLPKDCGFIVPKIYSDLSTAKVLTTEYMPGCPINSLLEIPQETRDLIARRLVWLALHETFVMRCMQTDPNWSNFLFQTSSDEKRVVLLDFGSARDFSMEFVTDYAKVIQAAAEKDRPSIIEWSKKLGFLTGEETMAMIDAHVEAVLALGLPFANDAGVYDFSNASEQVTHRIRGLVPTMVNYRLTPPPDESYSLHRKLSGVFLLCTRLKARVDCRSLLQAVLPASSIL